ncbi:MAG: tRNA lysidine(34) synthetase TilS, partial [Bacteroidales bacterium]|nr:tRNA lysidine(34) synthetase TilS [Bacteroidales bacterium]
MIEQFTSNIEQNKLWAPTDKLLLAVSGGIDSVVMADLVAKTHHNFGIAHCNFQLRGEESDMDNTFVKQLARNYKCLFHQIRFNTTETAQQKGISIQMAARELRYDWFAKLADEHGYNKILIAHNKNDVVETIFINLSRGTGIKGITGIKKIAGNIVRPLLFATRDEIEQYASGYQIKHREDSSNSDDKYLRNSIRHHIIPHFLNLKPSFLDNITHTADLLNQVFDYYSNHINELKENIFKICSSGVKIQISSIQGLQPAILYDILLDFNFTYDNIVSLTKNLNSQSGIQYLSPTHRLVKDRNEIIIVPENELMEGTTVFIKENETNITHPIQLNFQCITNENQIEITRSSSIACLDYNSLQFPLTIRKWKDGDFFYPLGLKGKKKLSDFFTDIKFSLIDKQNAWLVCSGEDIVWIVGQRIDDRFKITSKTKKA